MHFLKLAAYLSVVIGIYFGGFPQIAAILLAFVACLVFDHFDKTLRIMNKNLETIYYQNAETRNRK